jgi:hypothetical protein
MFGPILSDCAQPCAANPKQWKNFSDHAAKQGNFRNRLIPAPIDFIQQALGLAYF